MADEVVQTPFGKFLVNPHDCVGTTLKAGTLWDGPGFLQPLAIEHGRLGTPGITILDVGANIGAFTVWLARHGAWRVVAVEPVPQTMLYLKANLDLNQDVCGDVVIPLEVAGYDQHGLMALAQPFQPDNLGGTALVPTLAFPQEAIQARPLDDYRYLWEGGLSLIKVDAQGCDGRVLRGLVKTLKQHKPAIIFEWEEELAERHGDYLDETITWLVLQGYKVHPWPSQPNNYVGVPV